MWVSECKRADDTPFLVLVGHRSLLCVSECTHTYIHICYLYHIPCRPTMKQACAVFWTLSHTHFMDAGR